MKRALSLVLAAALVLGSVPAGFAATATAGETLKGYGLVAGDTNGNLNEDKTITRGEMMVVLARLLGKFEEAKAYSIPSTSKDVAGHWAANYIAYAEKEGWTAGKGNGMFDPQGTVTLQEVSVFMLKALGYTADWNTAVKAATDLGLLKEVVAKDAAAKVLRSDVFTSALNTINTPVKDTTVKLGVKLGVLKADVVATVKLASVASVANNLVEVKLTDAATAVKAADFAVTDKDGKVIEVKAADLIDSKTVWLTTGELAAGVVYTVKADVAKTFTAVAKDTLAPSLDKAGATTSSKAVDNVTVKLVFDKDMDPRSVLKVENYTVTNDLKVTAAAFAKDADGKDLRKEVILTTSAQKTGVIYKITVNSLVTDLAGNKIKADDEKNIFAFGGLTADTTAPKVSYAKSVNANKVEIYFTEDSDLNKATAETIANYTLTNTTDAAKTITITSVTLGKDAANSNRLTKVTLKTSDQVLGNKYEVKVANVTDKFGNVVSTTAYKATFTGMPADTVAPTVVSALQMTNTKFKLTYSEAVDKTTAETVANYTLDNGLTVVKAEQDADDENIVYITTSSQKQSQVYKVTVNNVKDQYNNLVKSSANYTYFSGYGIDDVKPTVASAVATVESGRTYVTVKFSEAVEEALAKVGSNYQVDNSVGYGVEATKVDALTYKVRVNGLEEGKLYKVTVANVTDLSGNALNADYTSAKFIGKATAEGEKPQVVGAAFIDKNTVQVLFSKAVMFKDETTVSSSTGGLYVNAADDNSYYTIKLVNDDKTETAFPITGVKVLGSSDKKSVTVKFTETLTAGKVYKVYVNTALSSKAADGTLLALETDKNVATFGTADVAYSAPKVTAVYAIDNTTVDVKFDKAVSFADGTVDQNDIIIKKDESGAPTLLVTAGYTKVLSSDKTVIRVKLTNAMTEGATYVLSNIAGTDVKDVWGAAVNATVDTSIAKFSAPSVKNDGPSVVSVTTQSATSVVVKFNKAVEPSTGALKDYFKVALTASGTPAAATYAKYVDSDKKDEVLVYFDNTGYVAGAIGKVTVDSDATLPSLVDSVGVNGGKTFSEDFALIDGERKAPKVSSVVITGANTVRVIFNKAVTGIDATDFDFFLGSATTAFDQADAVYKAGTTTALTASSYYDAVDLVLNAGFTANTTYKVAFATTTAVTGVDYAAAASTTDKAEFVANLTAAPSMTAVTADVPATPGSSTLTITAVTGAVDYAYKVTTSTSANTAVLKGTDATAAGFTTIAAHGTTATLTGQTNGNFVDVVALDANGKVIAFTSVVIATH